jgi:uroporphyrinogen-III synthase
MKIKNILISQVAPVDFEKSPYAELKKKYSINIDFYKFFKIENVQAIDFRKSKINIINHSAIVFASTTTIDHFFNLVKDLRIEIPETMKYFCITDQIAHYLQKYIPYRKRKIFFAKNNNPSGIFDLLLKNKEHQFLIPCGADGMGTHFAEFFQKHSIEFDQAVVFNTVPADLKKDIDIDKYDLIVFFSPSGIHSLKVNFPDFVQGEKAIGALGTAAIEAIKYEGWTIHIEAPTKEAPSITVALDHFLKEHATRRR